MWQPCRQAHTLRHSEHPDICKSTEVNNAQQAWEMETTVLGQNLLADEGVDARLTNLHPQSAILLDFGLDGFTNSTAGLRRQIRGYL